MGCNLDKLKEFIDTKAGYKPVKEDIKGAIDQLQDVKTAIAMATEGRVGQSPAELVREGIANDETLIVLQNEYDTNEIVIEENKEYLTTVKESLEGKPAYTAWQKALANITKLDTEILDLKHKIAKYMTEAKDPNTSQGRKGYLVAEMRSGLAFIKTKEGYIEESIVASEEASANSETKDDAFELLLESFKERTKLKAEITTAKNKHYAGGRVLNNKPSLKSAKPKTEAQIENMADITRETYLAKLSDHFKVKAVEGILSLHKDPFGKDLDAVIASSDLTTKDKENIKEAAKTVNKFKKIIEKYITEEYNQDVITGLEVAANPQAQHYQSIHRLLLEGAPGKFKLPDEVVTTLAVASIDALASMKESFASTRDEKATKALLGVKEDDYLSSVQITTAEGVDSLITNFANPLGAAANRLLGFTPIVKDGEPVHLRKAKLEAELGLLALSALKHAGVATTTNTRKTDMYENVPEGAKGQTVGTMQVDPTMIERISSSEFGRDNRIAGALTKLESRVTRPRLDGPAETNREVRNSAFGQFFELPTRTVDAVHTAEATEYKLVEEYTGFLKDIRGNEEEILRLKKALGWKDPENVHKRKLPGIRGKNLSIENDIGHVFDLIDEMEAKGKSSMWFNYKVISTGRFYIIASTFNPQAKKFHRFGATTKASPVTAKNSPMLEKAFAQAFGVDDDKMMNENTRKAWREVKEQLIKAIKAGKSTMDLLEMVENKEFTANGKGLGSHAPAHALAGILEFKKLQAYEKEYGTEIGFPATLPLEADAVTSGHTNRGVQMPLVKDIDTELMRGAMFTDKATNPDGKPFKWYAELTEHPNYNDNYNAPAKGMTDLLGTMDASLLEDLMVRSKKALTVNDIAKYKSKYQRAKELGTGTAMDEVIEQISRAFMKDPFMTFGYGSALNSIKKRLGEVGLDNLYDMLTPKDLSNLIATLSEISTKSGKDVEALKRIQGFSEVDQVRMLNDFIFDAKVEADVKAIVTHVLGNALETVFKDNHGVSILAAQKINDSFVMMFRLFKAKLDGKVREAELAKGLIVSEKDIDRFTRRRRRDELKKVKYEDLTAENFKELRKQAEDTLTAERLKARETNPDAFKVHLSQAENAEIELSLKKSMPSVKTAGAQSEDVQILISKSEPTTYSDDKNYSEAGRGMVKSKSGSLNSAATKYEWTEAASAGIVNTAQNIDAGHQSYVLAEVQELGVQDAVMFSIDNIEKGVALYLQGTAENGVEYSLTTSIVEGMLRVLEEATVEEISALDDAYDKEFDERNAEREMEGKTLIPDEARTSVQSVLESMVHLRNDSETAREELFNNQSIRSQHMYLEGVEHVINPEKKADFYKRADIKGKVDPLKVGGMPAFDKKSTKTQEEWDERYEKERGKRFKGIAGVLNVDHVKADKGLNIFRSGVNFSNPFANAKYAKNGQIAVVSAPLAYYEWLATNRLPEGTPADPKIRKELSARRDEILANLKTIRDAEYIQFSADMSKPTMMHALILLADMKYPGRVAKPKESVIVSKADNTVNEPLKLYKDHIRKKLSAQRKKMAVNKEAFTDADNLTEMRRLQEEFNNPSPESVTELWETKEETVKRDKPMDPKPAEEKATLVVESDPKKNVESIADEELRAKNPYLHRKWVAQSISPTSARIASYESELVQTREAEEPAETERTASESKPKKAAKPSYESLSNNDRKWMEAWDIGAVPSTRSRLLRHKRLLDATIKADELKNRPQSREGKFVDEYLVKPVSNKVKNTEEYVTNNARETVRLTDAHQDELTDTNVVEELANYGEDQSAFKAAVETYNEVLDAIRSAYGKGNIREAKIKTELAKHDQDMIDAVAAAMDVLSDNPDVVVESVKKGTILGSSEEATYNSPLDNKPETDIMSDKITSPVADKLGVDVDSMIAAEVSHTENTIKKCN